MAVAHRLLARRQVASASGQQRQPLVEPGKQRRRRKHLDPRGGQLDGQRQAIQRGDRSRRRRRRSRGSGRSRAGPPPRARRRAGPPDVATSSRRSDADPVSARPSGAIGTSRSPERRRRTRLVTSTFTLGAGAEQVGHDRARPRPPARSCRARAGDACPAGPPSALDQRLVARLAHAERRDDGGGHQGSDR